VLVDAVDDPNDLQDAETTEGDQGHALVALFAPDGKGLRYEKGRIADKGKTKDEGDEFSHGMYRGRGRFCLIHLLIFGPGKGGWQRAQRAKHLRWKYARVPMRMAVWIIFSVAFWSTSCGGPWQTQAASAPQTGEQQAAEPATKPAPPTPIAVKKAELGDDKVAKLVDHDHNADEDDKGDNRNQKFVHRCTVLTSIKQLSVIGGLCVPLYWFEN